MNELIEELEGATQPAFVYKPEAMVIDIGMIRRVLRKHIEAKPQGDELTKLRRENGRLEMALKMADGTAPLSKWKRHQGVRSLQDFASWVDMKLREYLLMAAKCDDPELTDWVAARKGTFEEVKLNLTAALTAHHATTTPEGKEPAK